VREDVGNGYDLVVANIVADVIIPLAPLVGGFAKNGGIFIASGIISDRLDEVLAVFAANGIGIIGQEELEGWHCVAGRVN
jgi:ribosomal protein L11 methyltransferase